MRRWQVRLAALLIVLTGVILAAYPWISNRMLERQNDSRVEVWQQEVADMPKEHLEELRQQAEEYNRQLSRVQVRLTDPFTGETPDEWDYTTVLASDGGIMGYLEIPSIDVNLPIFHGTSDEVLEKGVGHLEGTAIPLGGEGNHSVLSGHTGLNSARLLTDLTALKEGDQFSLHVLDETLTYRVCRILVVEPEDTECLRPEQDRDLVSLLTCTPYGVNTHRLVVTGERFFPEETLIGTDGIDDSGIGTDGKGTDDTAGSLWLTSYRRALAIGLILASALTLIRHLVIRWLRP